MRAEDWKGLITNASPYALPAGAATEQVNLQTNVSGQIVTRGGMWPLNVLPVEYVDIYPYLFNGATKLIALRANGQLDATPSPAAGTAPSNPSVPTLSPGSGQVQSNYIGQFYEYGGEAPV